MVWSCEDPRKERPTVELLILIRWGICSSGLTQDSEFGCKISFRTDWSVPLYVYCYCFGSCCIWFLVSILFPLAYSLMFYTLYSVTHTTKIEGELQYN